MTTSQDILAAVLAALQPVEELAAGLSTADYRSLMQLVAAHALHRASYAVDNQRPAGDALWRLDQLNALRRTTEADIIDIQRQLGMDPIVSVRVVADDLQLLIDSVGSRLYEEADERFRDSGNVIDPRLDRGNGKDPISLDEGEETVCELLDSHEPLITLLEGARQRLAAS